MRGFDWNEALRLPEPALAGGRRIPKTVLVKQAALTKTEQKKLDKVARLEHFATVQKSTTRIPPYADEERDVQSIIYLRCEMSLLSRALAEVSVLLHKCFPNPTVLLFETGDDVGVSVALTRKSLAEQGAMVVERVESTGVFDPGDLSYVGFIGSLAFESLPQDDLWAYLLGLSQAVGLSRAVAGLGFYPQCRAQDREKLIALVADYDKGSAMVRGLQEQRRSKGISLNDSAKLRVKMREEQQRLVAIAAEIKEICNG